MSKQNLTLAPRPKQVASQSLEEIVTKDVKKDGLLNFLKKTPSTKQYSAHVFVQWRVKEELRSQIKEASKKLGISQNAYITACMEFFTAKVLEEAE